jgi:hypothetical protein
MRYSRSVDLEYSRRSAGRPKGWKANEGESYHHVIPYGRLRNAWNRLVVLYVDTDLPDARVAMRQFLYLFIKHKDEIDSLMDRMRAHNSKGRVASQHRPARLAGFELNDLAGRLFWPPWNIVVGPKVRSDNPGEDEFDRFTVGLSELERSRMKALEALFNQLDLFINSGNTSKATSLMIIATAASAIRELLDAKAPIPFRSEMWFDEGNGYWRKRLRSDGKI